jgi:hypothetical protein
VLTISSIANDSATTALAMPAPRKNGNKGKMLVELIDLRGRHADVLGALIGVAWPSKRESRRRGSANGGLLWIGASASVREGWLPTNFSVD